MATSHGTPRTPGATSRRSSPTSHRSAAALVAFFLACGAGSPVHAQGDFKVGPAHGQNGLGIYYGQCATVWDPDGAGPNPPLLIVANQTGNVEAWDGSSFKIFGGLASGSIRSLGVYNGQLYVGGTFSAMGSDVVNNVARWDGSHWQPLGSGMTGAGDPGNLSGSVNSLVVHNGMLCIGGTFVPASTGAWTSFATWDGTTLTAGLATQAVISQLLDFNGLLFAATGAGVPGVYRYDTNQWTRFGNLADQAMLALTSYNDELICGGDFTSFFTGTTVRGVARWTGTQWVQLGGGLMYASGGAGVKVTSLVTYNGHLIAGGFFSTADGATVNNVAQWDGANWSTMDGGVHPIHNGVFGCIKGMALYNGELDAMGDLDAASGTAANGIARWDGTTWRPFTAGINAPVRALLASGSSIDVGGDFAFDWGSSTMQHAFSSDGSSVNPIGLDVTNGVNGSLRAFTLHTFDPFIGPELIAGGAFSQAGGNNASNVAAYSPSAGWQAMGSGFNGTVNALASYGGVLYAAGGFTASGATTVSNIAKWASGGWQDLGLRLWPTLYALTVANGQLIIGGVHGGKPLPPQNNGVSAWDGTTLTTYATADGPVYALAVWNGDIVAAGAFTSIGGVSAAGVAIRNHNTGTWSQMGANGFTIGVPYALAVYDGNLYAGGTIMLALAADYGRLQMWNGSTWTGLFGGLDGPVYALASFGNDLLIGGDFQTSSSGVQSPYLMRYSDGVLAVEPGRQAPSLALVESWPNPARGVSRITFTLERAGHARLTIHDIAGRQVRLLADAAFEAGSHAVAWNGRDDGGRLSPTGLYFYRLEADGRSIARRVVLTR